MRKKSSNQADVPGVADQRFVMPLPRTEMKCVGCGCFSSARYCWHCTTQPYRVQLLMRVLDYARMTIETAPLSPEHPLSIAVKDYYEHSAA